MSYIKVQLNDATSALIFDDGDAILYTQVEGLPVPMVSALSRENMQKLTRIYSDIQDEFTEKAVREDRGMSYSPPNFPFNSLNMKVHKEGAK